MTQKKDTGSAIGAAALGTAVGVALGASAVALSDKKNRRAALKKMGELKHQADTAFTTIRERSAVLQNTLGGRSTKKHMSAKRSSKQE